MPFCIQLSVLPDRFSVCRLPPDAQIPQYLLNEPFYSITRTSDELSLVLPEGKAEPAWQSEDGWRMLKVAGPLDFSLVGILHHITEPLSQAGISIFAISTFDTDYLLVKDSVLTGAVTALQTAGMEISLQGDEARE